MADSVPNSHALRILVVSHYFWPENFRINDLVDELSSRGHNITILTGKPNYPEGRVFPEYNASPDKYSSYGKSSIIRIPMLSRGNRDSSLIMNYVSFVLSASTIGLFKLRGKKFDVIFVFEPSPVTVGIPAIIIKKIKKTPVVFWVLDLWPETLHALNIIKSPTLLRQTGNLVSLIYNRCDLILGQSKGFRQGINKYCKDKTKFRYFPNWSESIFEKHTTSVAPEISEKDGFFNIVFTGNMGESQDFPSILDAAENIPVNAGVRWFIVGDGRLSDWLRKEVAKRFLQDRFFLLGRFPLERMPSFYNSASALLVALKRSPVFALTIPGKVQSYMSSGKPILAMLDGEGASLINDAKAGLTCPSGCPDQLAKNVIQMNSMSKEELLAMGQNAKDYAQIEFSKKTLIARLEQWLIEVCK